MLCCAVTQRLITVSQCYPDAPGMPDSQVCLTCREVSLVHEEPLLSCLLMGQYYMGLGDTYYFFYPKPPSVNSSAFLLWGTYPASDYELVTSAEAVLFPCNILLLQATELGGTRFKSGQSESSPRIVYKLEFFKKKSFFVVVQRPGF